MSRQTRLLLAVLVLAIAAPALLTGCFGRNQQGTTLDTSYVDGARYSYDVQNQSGERIGEATFATSKGDYEGTGTWTIDTTTDIPGSVVEESTVYTDQETLEPLYYDTNLKTAQGDYHITADYSDEEVVINAETPSGPQSVTRPKPDGARENDQLLMFVRALPLAEDYQTSFELVVSKSASKATVNLKVVGKETVTVPAGEYEAWKVQMNFGQVSQYAWYATDETRIMAKYDNGQTIFVLTEVQ